MDVKETKSSNIKKNLNKQYYNRERFTLSYSLRRYEDLKIITILQNEQGIKVNDHLNLKKSFLCKYLIKIGLEVLDKKYGQIKEILKKENMLEE
jgi:hypothetical protein